MRFQNVDDVPHPIEVVFRLVRDDIESIVPYLNDIEEIQVLERVENEDGTIKMVNRWQGSGSQAPRVVQKFLSRDLLSWTDYALWHTEPVRQAEWRLEPRIGGKLFECSGTTSVLEAEGGCQIKIEGDLRVYPERLPGVPRLLAGKLRTKIEAFIVSLIVPNMQTLARGVQNYLDDKESGMGDIPEE